MENKEAENFLVTYNWDNGYGCSCCRDEGTTIVNNKFSTYEEALIG